LLHFLSHYSQLAALGGGQSNLVLPQVSRVNISMLIVFVQCFVLHINIMKETSLELIKMNISMSLDWALLNSQYIHTLKFKLDLE
jgi:hypothetical protein